MTLLINPNGEINLSTVPPELLIKYNTCISVNDSNLPEKNLGFYPNSDYLLVEIFGPVRIFQTRKMIAEYLGVSSDKPVAIRAYGSRGISVAITMAHLMYKDKRNKRLFTTFSAENSRSKDQLTGLQIIVFPDLEDE